MTIKLAKNWRFWGIDINVFMGHLSTFGFTEMHNMSGCYYWKYP